MLLIVMHNKDSYLDKVEFTLDEIGIKEKSRIQRNGLNFSFIERNQSIRGSSFGPGASRFNKALIASVPRKSFANMSSVLNKIRNSSQAEEEGFVCTLPYEDVLDMAVGTKGGFMEISNYLKVKFTCIDLKSNIRDEVIKELVETLEKSPEVDNSEKFLQDVFAREAMQSTGIGNEIALPHARTDAVNKFIIALGRSRQGVDFKSLDNQPAKLVFLIGIPANNIKGYLKVLAYLTRLLKKEDFRKKLLEAKDEKAIVDLFAQYENNGA